jgi:hypothetical protein
MTDRILQRALLDAVTAVRGLEHAAAARRVLSR